MAWQVDRPKWTTLTQNPQTRPDCDSPAARLQPSLTTFALASLLSLALVLRSVHGE